MPTLREQVRLALCDVIPFRGVARLREAMTKVRLKVGEEGVVKSKWVVMLKVKVVKVAKVGGAGAGVVELKRVIASEQHFLKVHPVGLVVVCFV